MENQHLDPRKDEEDSNCHVVLRCFEDLIEAPFRGSSNLTSRNGPMENAWMHEGSEVH